MGTIGIKQIQLFVALATIFIVVAIVVVGIKMTSRPATNAKKFEVDSGCCGGVAVEENKHENSTVEKIEKRPEEIWTVEPNELQELKNPENLQKTLDDTKITNYSSKWSRWKSVVPNLRSGLLYLILSFIMANLLYIGSGLLLFDIGSGLIPSLLFVFVSFCVYTFLQIFGDIIFL